MQTARIFDGATIDSARDNKRLTAQYSRVFDLMKDAKYRTLEGISISTGDPAASISARLRDMRKDRFGAHTVERKYEGDGLYSYRLIVNTGEAKAA
jgi:hypothetical protein